MSRASALPLAAALLASLPTPALAEDPPLSVFGFVRLDFIVDDSRMSDVQSPEFVEPEAGDSDAEISLHPRLTRFGLSVDEWEVGHDVRGEAMLEVDFQDFPLEGAESAPLPRLRHAYMQLEVEHVEILAGHTWDLIAPLFPAANNDTLMWNAGNVGDRRPQFRLTVLPNDRVRIAASAGMPGAVDGKDADADGQLDGEAGAFPMLQYLIEGRTRGLDREIIRFGVWGHVGRDEIGGERVGTFSAGAHLLFPLSRRLSLLGEFFGGCNLSDIRGGIGQGVNAATGERICGLGGWGEAAFVASRSAVLALGSTIDRPDPDALSDGDRARNQTFYAVQRFRPHENFQLGLEYVHWLTRYAGGGRGAANRFNVHLSMFF